MTGLVRAIEHLRTALDSHESGRIQGAASGQELLPLDRGDQDRGGFILDGTAQDISPTEGPIPVGHSAIGHGNKGLPTLTPRDAKKRLEAVVAASRDFVATVRGDQVIEGEAGGAGSLADPRYQLSQQSIRVVRAVRRRLFIKRFGCGITLIVEEAESELDGPSLAAYSRICEFWADLKDRNLAERDPSRGHSSPESSPMDRTVGVEEVAALERALRYFEADPNTPGESMGSTDSGQSPETSGPSGRPGLGSKPERRFKRGELDEVASAVLVLNQEWANDQIAQHIGCNVKSLSSPRLRRFRKAREMLSREKERYQDASTVRGGRRRDKVMDDDI